MALAETTKAFLRRFADRSMLSRNLNLAADRDRFRDLAESLAAEVASLELGLSIDANATLLQIEETHAQDVAELQSNISALHATTAHTVAQNDELKAMLLALLAHAQTDARPRAEKATAERLRQAELPTIKVRARVGERSARRLAPFPPPPTRV